MPSPLRADPSDRQDDGDELRERADTPLVTRFGTAVGASACGAAIATVPAGLRIAASPPACGALSVWIVLVAVTFLPMLLAVVVLRSARVGLRAFGGPLAPARFGAFAVWLVLDVFALGLLGALLRSTTHHHALAAVTFALVALATSVLIALVSVRAVEVALAGSHLGRAMLGAASGMVVLAGVFLVRRLGHGEVPQQYGVLAQSLSVGGARAILVDGLALIIAGTFASRRALAGRRVLALLGPPAAALFLVLGHSSLRACPPIEEAIGDHAPVFGPLVELFPAH
jgi:hypothetical protein